MSRGGVFSLAFVAFLAVFREGAETILFYQALLARTSSDRHLVWLGMLAGFLILGVLYVAVRLLAIRIPLRAFFLGTSVLLAVMAVSFAGSGIKELQEAGLVNATPVSGVTAIDWLGIYPTVETLAAQAITVLAIAALSIHAFRRARRTAAHGTAFEPDDAATASSADTSTHN